MLADRQQLEMGEAEVGGVGDQLVGKLVVGEKAIRRRRAARTRDGPRRSTSASRRGSPWPRVGHIVGVGPDEISGVRDDRGGRGPQLRLEAEGIGLQRQQRAVRPGYLVFVDGACAEVGHEDLPEAAVDALAHLAAPAVPAIEVADDRDAAGVRRPEREKDARDALVHGELRAEPPVELPMRALDQQMIVERAERRTEGVGVKRGERSRRRRRSRPCRRALLERGDQRLEEVALAPRQLCQRLAVARQRAHPNGVGSEDADHPSSGGLMRAQDRERIAAARRRTAATSASRALQTSMTTSPSMTSAYRHKRAFQISVAYSAIVRSEENQPTLAVLRMLERIHVFWSRQASSMRICVAQ